MSRKVNSIADIDDSKETWKLGVRITHLWTKQRSPKPFIETIFLDNKVCHCSTFMPLQSDLKLIFVLLFIRLIFQMLITVLEENITSALVFNWFTRLYILINLSQISLLCVFHIFIFYIWYFDFEPSHSQSVRLIWT